MWDLPGLGLEPVSPALAGGFLTTVPPGKPSLIFKTSSTLLYIPQNGPVELIGKFFHGHVLWLSPRLWCTETNVSNNVHAFIRKVFLKSVLIGHPWPTINMGLFPIVFINQFMVL